ncbi:MAG: outer membrane beta-barrel protein [Myxococcota bacterium]
MIPRALAGAVVGVVFLGVASAPALAGAAEFFADAEAGGGYDGNLNAASNSGDAEGAGFGFASGGLGIAGAPGGALRGELSARWNGVLYEQYSDLSVQRLALIGTLRARATESITLRLSPSLGGSFHGDADRDTLDLGLGIGARFALGRRFTLDPGYTLVRRDAAPSVFDRTAHRFALALGAEPWKSGYLRLTSTVELGEVVRYVETMGGGSGGGGGGGSGSTTGRGRPNDTFGADWIADREDATSAELALVVEQGLTDRIFVALGGGYSRVWADSSRYDVYFTNASLGVRWP